MFRRALIPSTRDPEILVDSSLRDVSYVDSFGFEWQEIDGFVAKEIMSHGHVFGRFMLPRDFFQGKTVADIGCGNGRIGRLIAPMCASYVGVDLSQALYAFPKYSRRSDAFKLVRASGTDLPLADASVDVALCWGVLHHMDDPTAGLAELFRITKPGGTILVFVYSGFSTRKNLNTFTRGLPAANMHSLLSRMSDDLDTWREVDLFYANVVAESLWLSFKYSREWQKFQWFDGITPRYHWSIDEFVADEARKRAKRVTSYQRGCYLIET